MLQNAYFLAKIGADTAENEQHFAENLPKFAQKLEEKLENIGADHAVVLEPDGDVERRRLAVEHAVVAVVAPAAALAEERLARRDGFLRGAAAPRPRPDLDEPTCKKKHNPLY